MGLNLELSTGAEDGLGAKTGAKAEVGTSGPQPTIGVKDGTQPGAQTRSGTKAGCKAKTRVFFIQMPKPNCFASSAAATLWARLRDWVKQGMRLGLELELNIGLGLKVKLELN